MDDTKVNNETDNKETEESEIPEILEEVTKSSIRKKVWDNLEKNNLVLFPRPVHYHIPRFIGCGEAAEKLSNLDEFKEAKFIQINPDYSQEPVRVLALEAKKTIVVPKPRLHSGLFCQIDAPSTGLKKDIKEAAAPRYFNNYGKPVNLDSNLKIDLIVTGSVAVSKKGHRIGKGAGYADLEYALLKEMGAITDDTLVATTVHDTQVFDSLEEKLFGEHDVPVDIIVTPTTIIRVSPKLPKPKRIIWSLLSSQKIESIPILKQFREKEIAAGKDCTLKEAESDEEDIPRAQRPFSYRRFNFRQRNTRPSEGEEEKDNDGRKIRFRYVRTFQRQRFPKMADKNVDCRKERVNGKFGYRRTFAFSLKVGNIASNVRIRDLKAALAGRGIRPADITWRGPKGFAFLHFAKPRQTEPEEPLGVENVVASLKELKIKTDDGEGEFLKVEPAQVTRIEVTDISSV